MDNYNTIEKIKRLALISIFSNDYLMAHLVLKGGNAINMIYGFSGRASLDIDFSMSGEFAKEELPSITNRFKNTLKETFAMEDLSVFDIKFIEKPAEISDDMKEFWGGYSLTFKVTSKELADKHGDNIDLLRTTAIPIQKNKKVFKIDISRHEFCGPKHKELFEGYAISVYIQDMIVIEKLRSLCQKMKEYEKLVKHSTHRNSGRARDFYDIYILTKDKTIDLTTEANRELLKESFKAKRVPLSLLNNLSDYKEQHKQDYPSLRATINADNELKDFDFYFDYVLDLVEELKPFRDK